MIVDAERDTVEANFIRKLSALTEKQRKRVLDVLGYPPSIDNITADDWQEMDAELRALLEPILADVYALSANNLTDDLAQEMDEIMLEHAGDAITDDYKQRGIDWATLYVVTLASDLLDTTQTNLRRIVSQHNDNENATQDQFRDNVSVWFSATRVEGIAVTETTATVTAADRTVSEALQGKGFRMKKIRETAMDSSVCPTCSPWQGKEDAPDAPLHKWCRCWDRWEIVLLEPA